VFFSALKKASVFVLDTVRTNQIPNLNNVYASERAKK
jgi:hypothetical protein